MTPEQFRGLRSIHRGMMERCHNDRATTFKHYGARGISVCAEWRGEGGLAAFVAHVGARPSRLHTIDRIDGARGYEPGNVRWALPVQQANNLSSNAYVTVDGVRVRLREQLAKIGISRQAYEQRLGRGWPVAEALTTPPLCGPSVPAHASTIRRRDFLARGTGVQCCVCAEPCVGGLMSGPRLVCSVACAERFDAAVIDPVVGHAAWTYVASEAA